MKMTHLPPGLNATWHRRHPMPAGATIEQRVAWHEAHVHHCGCRPMPAHLVDVARRLRRLRARRRVAQPLRERGAAR
jgi:hypothetical protein